MRARSGSFGRAKVGAAATLCGTRTTRAIVTVCAMLLGVAAVEAATYADRPLADVLESLRSEGLTILFTPELVRPEMVVPRDRPRASRGGSSTRSWRRTAWSPGGAGGSAGGRGAGPRGARRTVRPGGEGVDRRARCSRRRPPGPGGRGRARLRALARVRATGSWLRSRTTELLAGRPGARPLHPGGERGGYLEQQRRRGRGGDRRGRAACMFHLHPAALLPRRDPGAAEPPVAARRAAGLVLLPRPRRDREPAASGRRPLPRHLAAARASRPTTSPPSSASTAGAATR